MKHLKMTIYAIYAYSLECKVQNSNLKQILDMSKWIESMLFLSAYE